MICRTRSYSAASRMNAFWGGPESSLGKKSTSDEELLCSKGGEKVQDRKMYLEPCQYITLVHLCMAMDRFIFFKSWNTALPSGSYHRHTNIFNPISTEVVVYVTQRDCWKLSCTEGWKHLLLDGDAVAIGKLRVSEFNISFSPHFVSYYSKTVIPANESTTQSSF